MKTTDRGANKTILLLEDYYAMRHTLRRALENRFPDATIYDAGSPETLRQKLAEHPTPVGVNVIISDQVNGERGQNGDTKWGVEFLRSAKREHPKAIRILVSAQTNFEDIQELLDDDLIHHFVAKTNDDSSICTKLADAVEQALTGNYDALHIGGDDLFLRDLILREMSVASNGDKLRLLADGQELGAEDIVNDPVLLSDFKRSMLHGMLKMAQGGAQRSTIPR